MSDKELEKNEKDIFWPHLVPSCKACKDKGLKSQRKIRYCWINISAGNIIKQGFFCFFLEGGGGGGLCFFFLFFFFCFVFFLF